MCAFTKACARVCRSAELTQGEAAMHYFLVFYAEPRVRAPTSHNTETSQSACRVGESEISEEFLHLM